MKGKEKEFAGYLKKSAGSTKGKAKVEPVEKPPVVAKKPKKDDIPDVQKETIAAKVDRKRDGTHTDIPDGKIPPSPRVAYSWKKDAGGVERYYRNEISPDGKRNLIEISGQELKSVVKAEFNSDFKLAKFGRDVRPESETKKIEEKVRSSQISAIKKLSGLSEDEARAAIDAIKKYSEPEGSVISYGSIRNVQRGILKTADGRDLTKAELSKVESTTKSINRYLEKMPSFDGVVHRGMSFDSKEDRDAFVSKISGGYSLEAMSSFSSSKNTAKEFASQSGSGVLFTVKNKSGVSIKRLSEVEEENEVLVPKDTRYRIVGKPKKVANVLVVEMEEF
jgi:hypothetical protein